MLTLLEDRNANGRVSGWYGGRNKKYFDMFDLTARKEFAYVFENESDAKRRADFLNERDWNFVVVSI